MATKSILTTYGNDRILDAIANDTVVPITAIAYGDGVYPTGEPSVDQVALVHQVGRLTSISKEFNSEDGFIYFKATIPASAEAFTLREFGLLDDQNKVLTVTVVPDIDKPLASGDDGVSIALPISIGFRTSTGEIMVIVEDGSDVFANTSLTNLNDTGEHHFDNVYANVDLNNLSLEGESHFLGITRITNCIRKEPQRIDYTLNNGTLTLKAGSVAIVPFGTVDLSTTYIVGSTFLNENFLVEDTQYNLGKFFVWVRTQNDISTTFNQGAYNLSVFLDASNNRLLCFSRTSDASGISPSGSVSYYNTSTNYLHRYSSGTVSNQNLSFPVIRATSNASKIVSVDEVFEGTSHIGNTIIIDKDVKMLIPDGRNADGSLNNINYTTELLMVQSGLSLENNKDYIYFFDRTNNIIKAWKKEVYFEQSPSEATSTDRVYYDFATNKFVQYISSTQYTNEYCELGTFYSKSTYLLNFKEKFDFRAVDYNDYLKIFTEINDLRPLITAAQNTANAAQTTANTAKAKADTSVQLSGNQTINDTKTFSTAPKVAKSTTVGTALQLNRRATRVIQLGDGTLIQWGSNSTNNHTYTVSLSYSYSDENEYKAIVCDSGSTTSLTKLKVREQKKSNFTVYSDTSDSGEKFNWITIGRGATA